MLKPSRKGDRPWQSRIVAYDNYFSDLGALSSDQAIAHPHMMTTYTPGFIFDPKLVMDHVRNQMRAGQLHMSCCSERDPTFKQWDDVKGQLVTMANFRQDLRICTPDETVMSSRKA